MTMLYFCYTYLTKVFCVCGKIVLALLWISLCWFAGQLFAKGTIFMLQSFGLADNLFNFLNKITL